MTYTTWSYDQSEREIDRIRQRVLQLEAQFTEVMTELTPVRRNKLAVTLHGGLDRAQAELNTAVQRLHTGYARTHRDLLSNLKASLSSMMTQLLDKVFKITPKHSGPSLWNPQGRSVPTPTAPCNTVATYTNGDVAGITIEYKQVHYTGSAKRNPTDKPDPAIGLAVAEAKAATKMAKALQRHADNLVADAERQHRKEQAEKNTARKLRRKEQQAATDRKNATRNRLAAEHYGRQLDSAITEVDELIEENRGLRRDVVRLDEQVMQTAAKAAKKTKPPVKKAAPRKAK